MKRGRGPQGNPICGCLYRMTPQNRFRVWKGVCVSWCVCACQQLSTWMRHHKLSPEASLGLEVDNQTALLIYPHAGGVHGSYENREYIVLQCLQNFSFPPPPPGSRMVPRRGRTLQLRLRRAADAVLPQNSRIVHEGEFELGLQVEMLPASHSHGRVEDVGHEERDTQGDVGLDEVQHLNKREEKREFGESCTPTNEDCKSCLSLMYFLPVHLCRWSLRSHSGAPTCRSSW